MGDVLFECTVEGPPVSAQTANRDNHGLWKRRVRAAAKRVWDLRRRPLAEPLRIIVTYYHEGPEIRLDNDNMVKPIQDALNGLVYEDDCLITDTELRKTCVDGKFKLRGLSEVLAQAFVRGSEFVHIRVERAPDHGDLT